MKPRLTYVYEEDNGRRKRTRREASLELVGSTLVEKTLLDNP